MAELDAKEQEAFEAMRTTFNSEEGFGLPMNDVTYGRYLRARYVTYRENFLAAV